MSRFVRAARLAAAGLGDDRVTLGEWAGTMVACDQAAGGADPGLREAVALVPLLARPVEASGSALVHAIEADATVPSRLADDEGRRLRMLGVQVSRAAAAGVDAAWVRRLLGQAERSLLEPATTRGHIDMALQRYVMAVGSAADALRPEDALAICSMQRSLLHRGRLLLDEFEVVDGVGHDRTRDAVLASQAAWDRALGAWRPVVPHRPSTATGIGRAIVAVQMVARDADPQGLLQALLHSGLGGNLVAASAVTPHSMRAGSSLVKSAVALAERADLAVTLKPKPVGRRESVTLAPVLPARPARNVSVSAGDGVVKPPVRVPDPDAVSLGDVAALRALAAQRDAGVLAEAALRGDPEASRIARAASRGDLEQLAERGRVARAAIVQAGSPIVFHWSRKVPPKAREEFVAAGLLRLTEIAPLWDPNRARWSTFAYSQLDFFRRGEARKKAEDREVVSDTLVRQIDQERTLAAGDGGRGVEEQVMRRLGNEEAVRLIESLPEELRDIAQARLVGATRPSRAQLTASTGQSRHVLERDEDRATGLLRERLGRGTEGPQELSLRGMALLLSESLREVPRRPPPASSSRRPGGGGPAL
ncbi:MULTISPECIES: coiled-coil domain-containing protein [Tessaracoccus]|uniref:hypothetical protein n=1 Tax=Tessaracoccus TaxID=72763 RepID=UPI00099CD3B4|nr:MULTISPECIES: hypothetical protein [Tessaracoccus]AQX16944.1 hypothetical protein BKM78_14240 [Tessaracoccus sp. T2.5-30]VEP41771.1 hypothetical protein TLA_TLA_02867 [Tessaracoccus lapidicaptus]